MAIRKQPLYPYISVFLLLIGIIALFFLASRAVMQEKWLTTDDYVEYWAAGRLNITGGNPYNPPELSPLQRQAGRFDGVPVIMYNPPWMLAIVMPFGAMNYTLGRTIWLLLSIVITIVCSDTLWNMYDGPPKIKWLGWLIGITFVPVLDCLRYGQTGVFMLLGVVGFLYFQHRRIDRLAGICLALLAIKPHILILLLLAVLLWCIKERRWVILISAIIVLSITTFLAWIVNPSVFQQYLNMYQHYPPEAFATATLVGFLRSFFVADTFWLQFIPPILGTLWFIIHWLKNRTHWDWLIQAPLIILVSLCTTAYGWTFDLPVILVAILAIFSRIFSAPLDRFAWLVIISYVVINGIDLVMRVPQVWLWWLAPSLLIWYLVADQLITHPSTTPGLINGEPTI